MNDLSSYDRARVAVTGAFAAVGAAASGRLLVEVGGLDEVEGT